MADDQEFLNEYFRDSGSEADFDGFEAGDIVELEENDYPTFEIVDLDNDDDIARDLATGWTRHRIEDLIPPFTGDSGLKVNIANDALPLEYFQLFKNDDVFANIAVETNRYFEQCRAYRGINLKPFARMNLWCDTSVSELKQFFGLTILTGLIERSSLYDYWTTDHLTQTPVFGKTMPRDRFFNLLSFIHLSNNETALPRGDEAYDPVYKVRPIYDVLSQKFRTVYIPEENISIDEGMVTWKGRLSFRQYLPNKPDKFGMKLYILCESTSGYMCDLDIYTGKDYDPNPDREEESCLGHSFNVMMGLLRGADLLNKGYTLFTNNYYCKSTLFDTLRAEDTLAVGTVRKNRKEMPVALTRKLKKGQEMCRMRGSLLTVKWTDKRDVYMLSTKHEPTMSLTNKVDRTMGEPIVKPTVIIDYNRNMGGVDLADQLGKYYTITRRTLKWWLKLFFHMMNLAITNAYILHKKNSRAPLSHYKFRRELAAAHIKSHVSRNL
ncbi:piggyBac transposable element-derived protein 4-like [Mizuhopecten yessoensis]|uniref:piggyBac transposable element-derived protein 4-like n=1 Tax=Mizuhopecten yessoensis TaxID=6573 RepID=UPI000B45F4A0|nr:piggyBac transposable element-derived protein 4-like [Mizuhopecten yessoensis]